MVRATDRATDARDRMLAAAYRYGAVERGGYDGLETDDDLRVADARLLEAAHYLMVVAEETFRNGLAETPEDPVESRKSIWWGPTWSRDDAYELARSLRQFDLEAAHCLEWQADTIVALLDNGHAIAPDDPDQNGSNPEATR